VCDERNLETNARLTEAGVQVIAVPGSELSSGRGGPRCMCCAITRDPAAEPDDVAGLAGTGQLDVASGFAPLPRPAPALSDPHVPAAATAPRLAQAR